MSWSGGLLDELDTHLSAVHLGLLLLLATPALLAWHWLLVAIDWSPLWLLAVAVGFGIVSEVLYQVSWLLASRKGYQYDYHRCEASWLEAGRRRTYKYPEKRRVGKEC